MPRDYAKKNRAPARKKRNNNEARVPAWVWLFTGAVLGAFIMFLIRLSEIEVDTQQGAPKVSATEKTSSNKSPSKPKKQRPRFDFYELLKETQANTSPPPETNSVKQSQPQKNQAKEAVEFILQVASFKASADAERLRAELILLNLNASAETAIVRNGETWHRVLVGPFQSKSKLAKARSVLLSNNHQALVLKRKL